MQGTTNERVKPKLIPFISCVIF